MKHSIRLISLFIMFHSGLMHGQVIEKSGDPGIDARMEWWNSARFGMFIHWGVSSVFGGEWDGVDHGKEMGGASAEWIYLRADIPRADYKKAAGQFNPVHYDPDEWVRMARQAGMKYMILTSKHHDGFAMFGTKASDWNIMQASPYKRDIIKMYTEACHAQGMQVGLYFSHEKDWFHHKKVNRDTAALSEDYIRITKTHLKELLTNYGKIDVIWFDMGIKQHSAFNRMLFNMVREHQPDCIISSRIGSGLGDYRNLRDRELAPPGLNGYVESIMTLRLNWGYDKNDSNWKSSGDVISMLSKCACRGSNFLLNMGPQPDGRFTPEEVIRLKHIGLWMDRNSEAIYGTSGSPFKGEYNWGSLSYKGNRVYLQLYNWQGGAISARGILTNVNKAYLLQSGEEVRYEQQTENAQLTLFVPDRSKEPILPIVVLELESELEVDAERGPVMIPNTIHHMNRMEVTGMATAINNTDFLIDSGQKEYSFSFNEHINYRINSKNGIYQVQGFHLEEGEEYKIIFTPYDSPVVEIITLLE